MSRHLVVNEDGMELLVEEIFGDFGIKRGLISS